ncbi:MAG: hypothetical protein HWE23_15185 [Rhodobacteraceae bacterium]|nr:hypothetical protein [Paracoccaceae bacterium]
MLKIFFYVLAAFLIVGSIAAWAYIVLLGCAYNTSSYGCGLELADFFDGDFSFLAAVPWLLGILCLYLARKIR